MKAERAMNGHSLETGTVPSLKEECGLTTEGLSHIAGTRGKKAKDLEKDQGREVFSSRGQRSLSLACSGQSCSPLTPRGMARKDFPPLGRRQVPEPTSGPWQSMRIREETLSI